MTRALLAAWALGRGAVQPSRPAVANRAARRASAKPVIVRFFSRRANLSDSVLFAAMPPRSRLLAFRDATRGIGFMLREEPNMRFHVVAATGVIVAAALLRLDAFEWSACIFAIVLVLLAEILNTAVEAVL